MPTIDLPLPPSTNALWRSNRGRVHRSRRYLAWLQAAGWELKLRRPRKIPDPVAIRIAAGRPISKRDLDNIATKAMLNLLTAHKVIADDSLVARITAGWDATISPGTVKVTIEPAMADAEA
jgi:Holliday junction resolvase RusA-like endonuclease